MIWFFKRRLTTHVVASVIAATLLTMLLGDLPFPVPNLGLGPAPRISLAMFLPSVTACMIGALTAGGVEREAIARRPVGLIDTGWNILLAAVAAAPHLAVLWATGAAGAGEAARNLLGFLGIGLVARRSLRGVAVTAAPALFAMVTAVLSTTTSALAVSWAYRPSTDVDALVAACALWSAGLLIGTGRAALAAQGEPDAGPM